MSSEQGSISGRVVTAAGAPVAGATVAVTASLQPHRDIAAITSADGTFRFGGMRPGAYRLEVRAQNSTQFADVIVVAGQRVEVEIALDG